MSLKIVEVLTALIDYQNDSTRDPAALNVLEIIASRAGVSPEHAKRAFAVAGIPTAMPGRIILTDARAREIQAYLAKLGMDP